MPYNPNKRLCQYIKSNGTPCLGYAQRNSSYCRAHNPDLPKRYSHGAGPGNRNAVKHGYYSKFFTAEDLMALATIDTTADLTDEIAIVRLTLRRLAACFDDDDLTLLDLVALARVLLRGASRVARLLETQRTLFGDRPDGISRSIDQALGELEQEWDIDLGTRDGATEVALSA